MVNNLRKNASSKTSPGDIKNYLQAHNISYPEFAKGIGFADQTVRGWMQNRNAKPMPVRALRAATRWIEEREEIRQGRKRTIADMEPEEWAEAARAAHTQGMSLSEFIVRAVRAKIAEHEPPRPISVNFRALAELYRKNSEKEELVFAANWWIGRAEAVEDLDKVNGLIPEAELESQARDRRQQAVNAVVRKKGRLIGYADTFETLARSGLKDFANAMGRRAIPSANGEI